MIIVTFEVSFEKDVIGGVREAFRIMDQETAKEAGCLKYVSSQDVNDPRIVRIYEMWESMEALVPHFQTAHMAAFQKALGGLDAVSTDARVYEVARELPFPNQ